MAASRKTIREWVASKLGRLHRVSITVDGGDPTLYDVPELPDITGDEERIADWYLMLDDGSATPEWRRVTSASLSASQLSISRAFAAAPVAGEAAVLYGLLNPDEWNEAINEALTTLYFPDRHEITLVEDEREYALPTWVQTRGQVIGVRYRNLTTAREEPVPRFRIHESMSDGVKLVLMDDPWSPSSYSLILEASRWHSRLDEDDWGTTCPQQLWQAAVEVSALHKVMKKYGQRFKAQFAQDLAIAERELLQMRAAILPTVQAREYATDDDWAGPDIDAFFGDGGWN
jgi:hypothetical protein